MARCLSALEPAFANRNSDPCGYPNPNCDDRLVPALRDPYGVGISHSHRDA
jgi:hypothetical protein